MTTTPANNQNQQEGLTPESLANKLFDIALSQGTTDPAQLSQQVIDFLGGALVYALTSAKRDIVIFFTETLLYFATHASPDPGQRAAMLKYIGDMFIAHAAASAGPPAAAPAAAPPAAAPNAVASPAAAPAASPPVGTPPGVPTPPAPPKP